MPETGTPKRPIPPEEQRTTTVPQEPSLGKTPGRVPVPPTPGISRTPGTSPVGTHAGGFKDTDYSQNRKTRKTAEARKESAVGTLWTCLSPGPLHAGSSSGPVRTPIVLSVISGPSVEGPRCFLSLFDADGLLSAAGVRGQVVARYPFSWGWGRNLLPNCHCKGAKPEAISGGCEGQF